MKTLSLVLVAVIALLSCRAEQPNSSTASFRDHKGQRFRMLNKASYRVLDSTEFYLYSYNKLVQGPKIARPATLYYFSTDAASPVQPLTIANLEKAFANNPSFLYKLHSDFKSDKDLITYIPSLNTYKIQYAYGQSVK